MSEVVALSPDVPGEGDVKHAVRAPDVAAPTAPLQHAPALDGVRGLAVCAVLAFHGGYLHGGYLGVDLFFTLSGFLITRLILDDLVRDRFSLREFWGRRARRLLPACWVLIAAVLLAGTALVRATELATLRGDAFATLGYVANWWQVVTSSSYFALFTFTEPAAAHVELGHRGAALRAVATDLDRVVARRPTPRWCARGGRGGACVVVVDRSIAVVQIRR